MEPNFVLYVSSFSWTDIVQDPVWKHRRNRHDQSNPNFDYEAWKRKHMNFADEAVPRWIDEVKRAYGQLSTKYACVGWVFDFLYFDDQHFNPKPGMIFRYCFGAPYVCNALAKENVTAGAFAHPAFLKEHHFTEIKSECIYLCLQKRIHWCWSWGKEPLFLSCAEEDHTFDSKSRVTALNILQSEHKKYHLQLFSGVEHGFALRGDMKNPYEREYKIPWNAYDCHIPRSTKLKFQRIREGAEFARHRPVVWLLVIAVVLLINWRLLDLNMKFNVFN